MIQLLHMDCMDYMAAQPDKAFDLAIVDPPYGIGESGGNESRNRVKNGGSDASGYKKNTGTHYLRILVISRS